MWSWNILWINFTYNTRDFMCFQKLLLDPFPHENFKAFGSSIYVLQKCMSSTKINFTVRGCKWRGHRVGPVHMKVLFLLIIGDKNIWGYVLIPHSICFNILILPIINLYKMIPNTDMPISSISWYLSCSDTKLSDFKFWLSLLVIWML